LFSSSLVLWSDVYHNLLTFNKLLQIGRADAIFAFGEQRDDRLMTKMGGRIHLLVTFDL